MSSLFLHIFLQPRTPIYTECFILISLIHILFPIFSLSVWEHLYKTSTFSCQNWRILLWIILVTHPNVDQMCAFFLGKTAELIDSKGSSPEPARSDQVHNSVVTCCRGALACSALQASPGNWSRCCHPGIELSHSDSHTALPRGDKICCTELVKYEDNAVFYSAAGDSL